ncbi:proteinase inhibitor I3 [Artemisia annua]|uniref:Proteinase inhibitor I3 n=1 Tax=Artemisia annua TaxID=35608 RepID=A0A2U1KQZ4_ARTAN|nr:proteinase inhibitor I3 [Artemisia annua]
MKQYAVMMGGVEGNQGLETLDNWFKIEKTKDVIQRRIKGVIRVSTDVNIKFSGSTMCHESNVWKFKYDKNIKQYAVMMGGVEGNPGPETLDNWFKIEKTLFGYKFVYCPSVCSTCKVMCKDLGIVSGFSGMQRLAVSKDPLSVNFYKNV